MPEPHYKPTKEELRANIAASQEALDNLPPEEPIPSEPVPSEPIPTPSKPIPGVDYKKRYSDSTREAQRLAIKNKELNKAIEEAGGVAEPQEEELKQEYAEWDEMTPTEQRLAKDNLLNKKKFDIIQGATAKFKQVDDWAEKVDTYVGDPRTLIAHPELERKTEEFKEFASQPTWQNVDFDNIVLGFIGDLSKNKIKHKGQMFPTGQGGGAVEPTKPSDGKISAAQGRSLMKTDYKKFKEMLKSGKIRNE
jgi:hypothetical protein